MYILALFILISTGLVSIIDILFGIKDSGEGIRLLVTISQALFFLSLLFFVIKMPTKKK
ncbi:hypothetical protein ABIC86_000086 [Paenibacillus sp. DS2363]|uniref:Uncharacterized protein n=1 Tax=Paenibacillus amylolyticus TaxID=1451 RepID=A0A117I1M0_PAEAM|nr:unknown protein [Paenibacillus amylolyticus]